MVIMDTRNKRASALGRSLRSLVYFPDPDGALSVADRLQISGLYAGINVILITLSQYRIFRVDKDNRTLSISEDNRVFSVDEDSRVFVVGGG